jgi:hypothetical protein
MHTLMCFPKHALLKSLPTGMTMPRPYTHFAPPTFPDSSLWACVLCWSVAGEHLLRNPPLLGTVRPQPASGESPAPPPLTPLRSTVNMVHKDGKQFYTQSHRLADSVLADQVKHQFITSIISFSFHLTYYCEIPLYLLKMY